VPIVVRRKVGTVADPIVPELPAGTPPDYSSPEWQAELERDVINFFKALARDHARELHRRSHQE
jgi:hypothetical protein